MREVIWFFLGCVLGWSLTYLNYSGYFKSALPPKKRKYVRKPKIKNPATLKE